MKFSKISLIGLSVLCFSALSLHAHAGLSVAAPDAQAGCPMAGHGRFAEHMEKHHAQFQARLHDQLKLSAEQEPAWLTFISQTKPAVKPEAYDRTVWQKLSAPERADKMLAQLKEHEARLAQHAEALKTFYAVLNAEQKKVFDEHFAGHGPFEGRHSGRFGKGPRAAAPEAGAVR